MKSSSRVASRLGRLLAVLAAVALSLLATAVVAAPASAGAGGPEAVKADAAGDSYKAAVKKAKAARRAALRKCKSKPTRRARKACRKKAKANFKRIKRKAADARDRQREAAKPKSPTDPGAESPREVYEDCLDEARENNDLGALRDCRDDARGGGKDKSRR